MYLSSTRKKPPKNRGVYTSRYTRICVNLFVEILADYLKTTSRPESGP